MSKKITAFLFFTVLILAACGGGEDEQDTATQEGGTGDTAIAAKAEPLYEQKCLNCHGRNMEGQGNAPGLKNVGAKYDQAEIENIIVNGKEGGMPAGLYQGDEAATLAEWLATLK